MNIHSITMPTKSAEVTLTLEELQFLMKNGFKDVKEGKIDKYGIRQSHTKSIGDSL